MRKFDAEKLLNMSIFELRNLARTIGVKSPTSKTKNILIKEILEKDLDNLIPVPLKHRGRPAKVKSVCLDFINSGNEIPEHGAYIEREESRLEEHVDKSVCGYVKITSQKRGIIFSNNEKEIGYISSKMMQDNDIRDYDYIEAMIDTQTRSVDVIQTLNRIEFKNICKRPKFEDIPAKVPNKRICLDLSDKMIQCVDAICPILCGQRGIINITKGAVSKQFLINFANAVAADSSVQVKFLCIDAAPEEQSMMYSCLHKNVDAKVLLFYDDAEKQISATEQFLQSAKREAESSNHVVFILDSISKLARAYNTYLPTGKMIGGWLNTEMLREIRRFIGTGRATENYGSISIYAVYYNTGSKIDAYLYEEINGCQSWEVYFDKNGLDKKRSGIFRNLKEER